MKFEEKLKKLFEKIDEFEVEEVNDSELYEELLKILEDAEPYLDDDMIAIEKKYKDFVLFAYIDVAACKVNSVVKPDYVEISYNDEILTVYP